MRAQRFIESRLADTRLGPRLVAGAIGVSERYLAKIFELSGQPVGSWIRERRLDWARRALVNPAFSRRSIGAIAYTVGFSDITHFSHAFRKRYGLSPRRYRGTGVGSSD
jgi:AraC-like DNA-binding protein